MNETELKPCDSPLKMSERYMQIRNTLDFQLRFAAFSKTGSILISTHDARMLLDATEVLVEILKEAEKDNAKAD